MTTPTPFKAPVVIIYLYETATLKRLLGRPQRWRFKALNGRNHRVLAVSSEAYTNLADALIAINQLFGSHSDAYLRQDARFDLQLRRAVTE